MFSERVNNVLRTFANGSNASKVFEGEDAVSSIMCAIDCGLCRLVKNEGHEYTMRDANWGITLGLELTRSGWEHHRKLSLEPVN